MINQTYEKLIQLKMPKMAELYLEQSNSKQYDQLSFDERISLLVDAEIDEKHNNLISGMKKRAKLRIPGASVSDIKFYPDRELDKSKLIKLSTGEFIERHENIILVGATGSGKTYIACALGNAMCNKGIQVRYVRLPDLLLDLEEAKNANTFKKRVNGWAKTKLLIIDEWMLSDITKAQRSDILELLELRYENTATIFASQYAPEGWINKMGNSPITDSIMDRIVSSSHLIEIKGDTSMRQRIKDKK